jgi:hypothetical protein
MHVGRIIGYALIGAVLTAASARAQSPPAITAGFRPYQETVADGMIDWGAGDLVAVGYGEDPQTDNQGRLLAERAATIDAARNALLLAEGIRLDADGRVVDIRDAHVHLEGVIQGHKLIDREFTPLENGAGIGCRVKLQVPLYGARSVLSTVAGQALRRRDPADTRRWNMPRGRADVEDSVLIIDARGIGACACLYPAVRDRSGMILCDCRMVASDVARQRGMARYVVSEASFEELGTTGASWSGPLPDLPRTVLCCWQPKPAGEPQGTSRPATRRAPRRLVLRAEQATGKNQTQLVLTPADAAKLRDSEQGAELLRQGKVVIVMDAPAAGAQGRRPTPEGLLLARLSDDE